MKKRKNTLSFLVVSINERQTWGVPYFETVLKLYGELNETITIRGKPWPIGAKVDSVEFKVEK